jgi:hypothetical protein
MTAATFKPQAKSNAKRFLISTCKVVETNVEAYLTRVDGQWGTWVDEAGKAVPLALVNIVEATPVIEVNPFAQLLGQLHTPVTSLPVTVVVDGKVSTGEEVEEAEEKAPRSPAVRSGNTQKGYTIDKGRETRNGVTRPSAETICGKVWAYFDANPSMVGTPIKPIAEANGWSKVTVSCQLRVWRKFYDVAAK